MKIVIAGRPNTGKSTLFNALTGTRDALVHDRPGVTRDTISGTFHNRPYTLVDTAGLERANAGIALDSTNMAIDEIANANAVLFVVDGRVGLTNEDLDWAKLVRRKTKAPVKLLVNKSESEKRLANVHDFYKLGFGEPVLVAAEHKRGFDSIMNSWIKSQGMQQMHLCQKSPKTTESKLPFWGSQTSENQPL